MVRIRRTLVRVALVGWLCALISQLLLVRASDDTTRSAWTARRNQCLLVSSLAMNSAVVLTVYAFIQRFRDQKGNDSNSATGLDT
ncbi:hypothetical protein [Natronorubrum sp. A-ect3]|uniref:hypothetical protein n=1 Tax=Natronorubrum sp. A-ect3 TaxID=3242698 RepID=UPI00359DC3EE